MNRPVAIIDIPRNKIPVRVNSSGNSILHFGNSFTFAPGGLPEWSNGAVSKTVVRIARTKGSNPLPSAKQKPNRQVGFSFFTPLGTCFREV